MTSGVVLRQHPGRLGGREFKRHALEAGVGLAVAEGWVPPWPRTLFVAAGVAVPWDLLGVGFGLLERWEAAAPFSPRLELARDVGTPAGRERTRVVAGDLRVPVHALSMLFVRQDSPLLDAWRTECGAGGDERLAFLRALAIVKPAFCALPRTWLATARERAEQDAASGLATPRPMPRSQRGARR